MKSVVLPAAIIAIATAARPAGADEPTDRQRAIQLAVTAGMGATYLIVEFGFNTRLAPTTCRWCDPPGFDRAARDSLRWQDTAAANTISNVTGYVLAPIVTSGLTMLASRDRRWRRYFDDVTPIVQSAIAVSLLQHAAKFTVGRQRPYAHFSEPGSLTPSVENNVSFWSGHTSLGFSLAVSAGTIATRRGYRLAPAVWASGLALAAATGWLRIAADRHYTSDVLVGAVMGSAVGVGWPLLVHRHIRQTIIPTGNGMAIVGAF